jgi:hypothetical protein
MKQRCNGTLKNAISYFERGITYEPSWELYDNFIEDMGERPEGTTLDRIDNESGYSKDNCRWASLVEQANNRRNNRLLVHNDETLTLAQWARRIGLSTKTLGKRLSLGWTVERALTAQVRQHRKAA